MQREDHDRRFNGASMCKTKRVKVFYVVVVTFAALAFTVPASSQLGDQTLDVLYVPNRLSDTVSVIDIDPDSPRQWEVIHTILLPLKSAPTAVVATSDGDKAYSTASFNGGVYPSNTRNLSADLSVDPGPVGTLIPTGASDQTPRLVPPSISVTRC